MEVLAIGLICSRRRPQGRLRLRNQPVFVDLQLFFGSGHEDIAILDGGQNLLASGKRILFGLVMLLFGLSKLGPSAASTTWIVPAEAVLLLA